VQTTRKAPTPMDYDVTLTEDTYRTGSPDHEQVIEKWNAKLSQSVVRLEITATWTPE